MSNSPTIRENFRVVVEPDRPLGYLSDSEKEVAWGDHCEDIINEIKRHVDGVAGMEIEWDTICKFCRLGWDVHSGIDPDYPKGLPGCCNKAQDEWKRQQREGAGV